MKITENIYWTITGKVKDGELENMKKAIEAMVVETRTEDGAMSYDFWLSEDDTTLYIDERYKDSQATLEHMKNVGNLLPAFIGCVDLEPITIIGNYSTELKHAWKAFGAKHVKILNCL